MPSYEPDDQVTFSRRTYVSVLFVMACLLAVAFLLLHFNHA